MIIDDPAVQALAEEIAARTGQTITEVLRSALQDRKDQLPTRRASEDEIHALLDKIHALPPVGPWVNHGDLLYGEDGLPK